VVVDATTILKCVAWRGEIYNKIAEEGVASQGVKKAVYEYVQRVQGVPACRTAGHGRKAVQEELRVARRVGGGVEPSAHQRLINR
jgi:hypothetical protein